MRMKGHQSAGLVIILEITVEVEAIGPHAGKSRIPLFGLRGANRAKKESF